MAVPYFVCDTVALLTRFRSSWPGLAKAKIAPGVRYYPMANARAETISKLSSFAKHWKAGPFCLLPATAFYEPNLETGKAVRWKIGSPDGEPFTIAGLWRSWPDGGPSFTMPTLNADSNPLLRRFHKPWDEKRGVVILHAKRGLLAAETRKWPHHFVSIAVVHKPLRVRPDGDIRYAGRTQRGRFTTKAVSAWSDRATIDP